MRSSDTVSTFVSWKHTMLGLADTTTWYMALLRAGELSPRTFHTNIFGGCVAIDKARTSTLAQPVRHSPSATSAAGRMDGSQPNKARMAATWPSVKGREKSSAYASSDSSLMISASLARHNFRIMTCCCLEALDPLAGPLARRALLRGVMLGIALFCRGLRFVGGGALLSG